MTIAIYPGTFDPLTSGHEDIISRASAIFDELVLAIADSNAKNPLFDVNERVQMATEAVASLPNVRVIRFTGLMVDCVREQNAGVVVRGVRSIADFEYELQLAGMNRQLLPGLETIFLMPSDEHQHVSGTLVREIARMGGAAEKFVSPQVMQWIRNRVPAQQNKIAQGSP